VGRRHPAIPDDPKKVLQYGTDGDGTGRWTSSIHSRMRCDGGGHLRGLAGNPGSTGAMRSRCAGLRLFCWPIAPTQSLSSFFVHAASAVGGKPSPTQMCGVSLRAGGKDGPKFLMTATTSC